MDYLNYLSVDGTIYKNHSQRMMGGDEHCHHSWPREPEIIDANGSVHFVCEKCGRIAQYEAW